MPASENDKFEVKPRLKLLKQAYGRNVGYAAGRLEILDVPM